MEMKEYSIQDPLYPDTFFSTYWRKKPVFVQGGAGRFLGRNWSETDFEAAHAKARAAGQGAVKEQLGEVTFIEKVSTFDSDLAVRAAEFGRTYGAPQAWFDAVRTYSNSGIGAHFDHSDNFVLQQTGVKEWTLASPRHIDRAEIARRMMNVPGVGAHAIPEGNNLKFTLEPGDLLYIPLFWLHSGVSHSNSLSLSLVCPAVSLFTAVMPLLTHIMREKAMGYQPVPAFHVHLSHEDRRNAAEILRKATRALLERVCGDDVLNALLVQQIERLPGLVHPDT